MERGVTGLAHQLEGRLGLSIREGSCMFRESIDD
jgi:hypothetical protein